MKKLFSAMLAFIFLVSAAVIPAECVSSEDVSVNLSSVDYNGDKVAVRAKQGDTVEIVTIVRNAKLVNGLLINMYYDSELLGFEDLQKTNLGRLLVNTPDSNRITWSIMFAASGTNFENDTEVSVLKFKAKSDIASDTKCFSYSIEEFYNTSYSELSHSDIDVFCRVNGNRIIELFSPIYGDANNDGKVSNADALAIVRHAIKASVLPLDRLQRCDVNGDGKVTNADALQITRYCIGYKSKFPIGESV